MIAAGFAARALLMEVCSVEIEPDVSLTVTTLSPEGLSMNVLLGTLKSILATPCPPKLATAGKIRRTADATAARRFRRYERMDRMVYP
jgi:hypothetical protein